MNAALQDLATLEGPDHFPDRQSLSLVGRARRPQAILDHFVGKKRTIETQIRRAPLGVSHRHVARRDVGVNFRARLRRALLRA